MAKRGNIDISNVFLRIKPVKIILSLRQENNCSKIAYNNKITYSHVAKLLPSFREKGLITLKKEGRTNKANLTDKGKNLLRCLEEILTILDGVKDDN